MVYWVTCTRVTIYFHDEFNTKIKIGHNKFLNNRHLLCSPLVQLKNANLNLWHRYIIENFSLLSKNFSLSPKRDPIYHTKLWLKLWPLNSTVRRRSVPALTRVQKPSGAASIEEKAGARRGRELVARTYARHAICANVLIACLPGEHKRRSVHASCRVCARGPRDCTANTRASLHTWGCA